MYLPVKKQPSKQHQVVMKSSKENIEENIKEMNNGQKLLVIEKLDLLKSTETEKAQQPQPIKQVRIYI
jgi:hypothetical protein